LFEVFIKPKALQNFSENQISYTDFLGAKGIV